MKQKIFNLFWGLVLILAGGLFLANNLGYLIIDSVQTWMVIFAVCSVLFFISYFVNGIQNWGWLFPACITAALAGTLALVETNNEGTAIGALVLASVAIPFWVAFALAPRQNWWALIPGWTLTAITAIVFFADRVQGEIIGAIVLLAVALPFLVVYITDRSRWWALIPGGIVGGVAVIPLLTLLGSEEWVAPLIVIFLAVPFLVVYFLANKHWWALIPGGVLLTAGITTTIAVVFEPPDSSWGIMNGIFFLGMAATFGILWLLRNKHNTAWAKYPAIVLAIIGLVTASISEYWPVLIIAVGLWTLYLAFRSRKTTA